MNKNSLKYKAKPQKLHQLRRF